MQAGCIRATDTIWGRSAPKHEPVVPIREVTFDPGNEDPRGIQGIKMQPQRLAQSLIAP